MATPAVDHVFLRRPHREMFVTSVPVFFSLIAEPITGLVDTAFVKELGAAATAALGVGTIVLSSVFWVFNFLAIGTQTEVARALGAGRSERARAITSLAATLAAVCGLVMFVVAMVAARPIATAMGAAAGEVQDAAVTYIRIRAVGAPLVIVTAVCFGALRGLRDMRTPLWIAVAMNLINIGLDALLIYGAGPIPALGIAGAAWASVIAQSLGAGAAVLLVAAKIGLGRGFSFGDAKRLLVVGADLFVRTGLLTAFLLLTTRAATRAGDDAGAAHQAVRNVWLFAALALDAYAATAQSFIGFFRGADRPDAMRAVARTACVQSAMTGGVIMAAMLAATPLVEALLVPDSARPGFRSCWWIAAVAMPINAIAFATDGIHWGTADYRFLRNGMLLSTALAGAAVLLIDGIDEPNALAWIWTATAGWILIRSIWGAARIWPGSGPWR